MRPPSADLRADFLPPSEPQEERTSMEFVDILTLDFVDGLITEFGYYQVINDLVDAVEGLAKACLADLGNREKQKAVFALVRSG